MRTRTYWFGLFAGIAMAAQPAAAVRMQGTPSIAALAPSAHFVAASPGPYAERSITVERPLIPPKGSNGRRQMGVTVDLAKAGSSALSSRDIEWRKQADGTLTGYFRVQAKGAFGVRAYLALHAWSAGLEARFRAAGADDADYFSLKSRAVEQGGVWSPLVNGDTLEAEIILPAGTSLEREIFAVSQVSALTTPLSALAKSIGQAASCERDVKCYALGPAALNNAKATVLLAITNSSGTFGCTGTLLNTTTGSHVPYVLTFSDCVTNATEAASVNGYWDYEATACGSNSAQAFTRTTGGATLVARDAGRHYSFLQLSDAAPSVSYFSGWDSTTQSSGTPVAAVHHPQSDLKKLSQGSIVTAGAPLQVQFTSGVTEGGSVGGGIFRDDQYLVGVLYAGESSCTNQSGLDDFWPLSDMWSGLAQYLKPSSTPAPASNYSDIWWNPNESGWGLTIADHETQLFAVWYTYRQDGSPTWFVIPGGTLSSDRRTFSGAIYETTGPAYTAPFNPGAVTVTPVGNASFDFAPSGFAAGTALFTYDVGGASRTVQIQRQSFGNGAPSWGSDFTDIWWNPDESGWGLTLSQHGNNIFGVWYTYDAQGRPLFVVMPGVTFSSGTSFTGDLYTTTGPYYGNATFDPGQVRVSKVGSASLAFTASGGFINANKRASFIPTINGYTQTKTISGQSFGHGSPSGTTPTTHRLTVTMSGTGNGVVSSQPGGINCGAGACFADFSSGSTVTLSASANTGSKFVAFTGTCSNSSGSCTLTMSADATVNVQFDALPPPSNLAIAILALPDATAGQAYDQLAATATGGSPPYHYQSDTFANGTPPPGVIVALDGHVQGTPSSSITATQTYTFGICVVDLAGTSRCAPAQLTVNPAAPQQNGNMSWNIGDQCNNGMEVDYKFFDRANNLVWPSATTHYIANYGQSNIVNKLACIPGAQVCLGGQTADGSSYWGVGFAGNQGCASCCGTCDGKTYGFTFGCNSPPPAGGSGQCSGLNGGPRACTVCSSDADCDSGDYCWKGNPPAPFCPK